MKSKLAGLVVLSLLAGSAWADLKPDIIDCDGKKVARNAAMKSTVGVSGPCDAGKVAEDARDDVVEGAKDAVDDAVDLKPQPLERDRDNGKLRRNKD